MKIVYICSVKSGFMETIRLEFQPKIKAKIMELLSSFSSDELKIVEESLTCEVEKQELDVALAKIKNKIAKFYTMEEVDAILEETISKYEN